MSSPLAPDAELLIATGCAHCPVVLEGLSSLLKEGLISQLTISNMAVNPARARELGVRSVPWARVGPFILEGLHSPAELREWVEKANSNEGIASYIQEQIRQGQLEKVELFFKQYPQWLPAIIPLLKDEDTEMQIRLGLDVVLESLQPEMLQPLLGELAELSQHRSARIRGDATHYLSLTKTHEALPWLEKRLDDEQQDVREIAREAIEAIKN